MSIKFSKELQKWRKSIIWKSKYVIKFKLSWNLGENKKILEIKIDDVFVPIKDKEFSKILFFCFLNNILDSYFLK